MKINFVFVILGASLYLFLLYQFQIHTVHEHPPPPQAPPSPSPPPPPPPPAPHHHPSPSPILSIVVPFPPKQLHLVLYNVEQWKEEATIACTADGIPARLLFFLSYRHEPTIDRLNRLIDSTPLFARCFAGGIHIEWLQALPPTSVEPNVYNATEIVAMFYHFFAADEAQRTATAMRTDYMLWMEPDCLPIRRRWLESLVEVCEFARAVDPFFVLGSHPRYSVGLGDYHLNGNALYYVANETLRALVRASRGAFNAYVSFDQSLFVHLMQNKERRLTQRFFSLYKSSELIHNIANDRIDDLAAYRRRNPHTLLVHGKGQLPRRLFY